MTLMAGAVSPSETNGDLNFLPVERERVERALAEVRQRAVMGVATPLREPVEYALSTAGKRLRPILCVSAFAAARPGVAVPNGMYQLACSLEIVHTYSLLHDDLPCMDNDDLRRGRPTAHRVFGVAKATLAGAALIPISVGVLEQGARELGLGQATRARLVIELAEAIGAGGMVGGQVLDLEAEGRELLPHELEQIHRKKTASLLTSSLRIGAIAGNASDEVLARLTCYGAALGLAFQIADDLLDVVGESERIGKTAGRDHALRKSSYPALHGIDGARALARERVDEAKDAVRVLGRPELLELADYVIERGR